MNILHVYPQATAPKLTIEREPPAGGFDHSCTRCALCDVKNRTRCMETEAEAPGGPLFLSEYPGVDEDRSGHPMTGETGRYFRSLIQQHVTGPFAIDNALRCAPRSAVVTPKHVNGCRGYLAAALAELKPSRILALGGTAIEGLLGHRLPVMSVRNGYTYLSSGVPVFYLMNPVNALRNRFLRAAFEEDFLWALRAQPPLPPWKAEARIVESEEDALAAERDLMTARWFAVDVEWSGLSYRVQRTLCVSCAPAGRDYAYVWTQDGAGLAVLKRLMENPLARKVGQNFKSDLQTLAFSLGIKTEGVVADARLMRKVLDPDADADLELMQELVGMGGGKAEAKALLDDACATIRIVAAGNTGKTLTKPASRRYHEARQVLPAAVRADVRGTDNPKSFAYALLPPRVLHRYNAADAISTARLVDFFENRLLDRAEADFVWQELVQPGVHAVAAMERWGVAMSRERIEDFQTILNSQLQPVRARLDAYDPTLNPDSPKQVAALLYDKLKLPVLLGTETESGQPSTADEVLEALAKKHPHPILADINEHRRLTKLRGTYAAGSDGQGGMLAHVRADGRIHPSINLDGARSGRTSCSDPNLQNIPRADSAEGKLSRDCFISSVGHCLAEFDYSQLELRIAAALSNDPVMIADFLSGEDFHLRTAKAISKLFWGIEPDKVTKAHRTLAKGVNFGLAYGKTARTFSEELGIPLADAERLVAMIMGRFRVFAKWREERLAYSRRTGFSWTEWRGRLARRRALWNLGGQDDYLRSIAEHGSYNTPVQGTASDYCVASIIAVVRWIEENFLAPDVMLVLPVHDSLMLDVREDLLPEVVSEVSRIMTSWPIPNGVPLEVEVKTGPSWGSLVKWKGANSAAAA